MEINVFQLNHAFLSSLYPCKFTYKDELWPSVENAYQAMKCYNRNDWKSFLTCPPTQARFHVPYFGPRADWKYTKNQIMYDICRAKFQQNRILAKKLMHTGRAIIRYHSPDVYWGVHLGCGENHLGRILMKVRHDLFLENDSKKIEISNQI